MKKKLCIASILVVIIAIIIVAVKGFNVELKYKDHKVVNVQVGTEYNEKEINSIVKEVLGKEKFEIEKSGIYGDEFIINTENISDEQIESIKNKINEKYNVKQKISVKIKEGFNVDDVKSIANETFGKEDMIVEKSKDSESYATIETGIVSDADLEKLNTKINEKFELTNKVSSINVYQKIENTDIPKVKITDMLKQYVLYTVISFIVIFIYFIIRFIKLGIKNVALDVIKAFAFSELLYAAIIAIVRIPVNKLSFLGAFAIYIAIATFLNKKFINESVKKVSK